jgi:excisionase family DNA binding protein
MKEAKFHRAKGPRMTLAIPRSSLLTYDEAANLLGIQRASVKQLVTRGRLHSIPAPEDRRRRLLTRPEVEAYAREHAGKWSYEESLRPLAGASTPMPDPALSPDLVLAGSAGVATAGLLIKAFRIESDVVLKVLILGAVVGLALMLLMEWARQGKVNAAQQRRMEQLAKQAEVMPDTFLEEFEQLLTSA